MSIGSRKHQMRYAPAGEQTAMAVITLGRDCAASEVALTGSLLDIAGVSRVHLDASRCTIQVLYDGERVTAENVHHFLAAAHWGNRGHER